MENVQVRYNEESKEYEIHNHNEDAESESESVYSQQLAEDIDTASIDLQNPLIETPMRN